MGIAKNQNFIITLGETLNNEKLQEIMELDKIVYDTKYITNINDILDRYRSNNKSFIVVYNVESKIVGYMNMFPVKIELYDELKETRFETDINIRGEDFSKKLGLKKKSSKNGNTVLELY